MDNEENATSAENFLPLKKNHIPFIEMQKEKGRVQEEMSKHIAPTLHTTQVADTAVLPINIDQKP